MPGQQGLVYKVLDTRQLQLGTPSLMMYAACPPLINLKAL